MSDKPVFTEKPAFPEATSGSDADLAAILAGAPEPLGPANIEAFGDVLSNAEKALPLNDHRVLCNNCIHGWIMAEPAAVKNLRPDGTPFMAYKGFCLLGPLSLTEIHPTVCNRHSPPAQDGAGGLLAWFRRRKQ